MLAQSKNVLYDLDDFAEYVDLKRFQYALCSLSGTILAIATESSLILTNDTSSSNGYYGEDYTSTRLVLEFNEDAGKASCIQWVIEGEVVAVGFETGLMVCFNCKGEEIYEFKGSSSIVQSIKVASTPVYKAGAAIWLLYEEGLLVSLPIGQVLDGRVTETAAYRLTCQAGLNDFVFYPHIYRPSVFDLEELVAATESTERKTIVPSKRNNKTTGSAPVSSPQALLSVFAAGLDTSMALYNLGIIQTKSNCEKNSSLSARDSAVNIISKGVMSLSSWFGGSTESNNSNNTSGNGNGNGSSTGADAKTDEQKVQDVTLVVTARVEFKDPKRRILKLSADPSGLFIAAADSLGRVTLWDSNVSAVVRLWKGLRFAELAWTTRKPLESLVQSTTNPSAVPGVDKEKGDNLDVQRQQQQEYHQPSHVINLAIHAPLLGLVYIYSIPHGGCIRIIPVGLNCHIFTMNVRNSPPSSASFTPSMANIITGGGGGSSDGYSQTDERLQPRTEVRAYLLKPLLDKGGIELTEIQPADLAATDLDVRLTLVGAEEGGEDDYWVGGGDGGDSDSEVPNTENVARRRFDSFSRGLSAGSNNEAHAIRNIEQSLLFLLESMPMTAIRQTACSNSDTSYGEEGFHSVNTTGPMSRLMLDLAVERAEESILELLSAHKSVIGMNALYKCMCMVESVELFGQLTPPSSCSTGSSEDADAYNMNILTAAVTHYSSIASAYNSALTANTSAGASSSSKGARGKLSRGLSWNSVPSLASETSIHSTTTVGAGGTAARFAQINDNNTSAATTLINKGPAALFLVGLIQYPAFSAHLHKTLISLLMDAIKTHEQDGRHKYQYDVAKGEVTHLPAHILKHLKAELPIRLKHIEAYTTFQSLGTAADQVRQESTHQNEGFSASNFVNSRHLFDRNQSITGTTPTPITSSSFGMLGTLSPLPSTYPNSSSSTSTPSTTAAAAASYFSPSAGASNSVVKNTLNAGADNGDRLLVSDDLSALIKQTTLRAEAAMWCLRAAQNQEAQVAYEATMNAAAAALRDQRDNRFKSTDSASSFTGNLKAALLNGNGSGVGIRTSMMSPSKDSSDSMDTSNNANTHSNPNSHSKVRRIAGRDVSESPTQGTDQNTSQSPFALPLPAFPTEYRVSTSSGKGGTVGDISRLSARARSRSRSGSSNGKNSDEPNSGVHDPDSAIGTFGKVSFTVFRAFHRSHHDHTFDPTSKLNVTSASVNKQLHVFYNNATVHEPSSDEAANTETLFSTQILLSYVLKTQAGPLGFSWSSLCTEQLSIMKPTFRMRALSSANSVGSSTPASPHHRPSHSIAPDPTAMSASAMSASASASAGERENAAALFLPTIPIETVIATTNTSHASSAGLPSFTLNWSPEFTTPHTMLNFLVSPLAGDIFSLTSLHDALKTMGIANKIVGLKHMAPIFCLYLARQPTRYLLTDILVKKLSTFPFQRWLRDSLLGFQDSLTVAEREIIAKGGRTVSLASRSVSTTADVAASGAGAGRTTSTALRQTMTSSAETDARHVAVLIAKLNEAANEVNAATINGTSASQREKVHDAEESDLVFELAKEIHVVHNTDLLDTSDATDAPSALPSYDNFIRHILRPAWLCAHQCSNLEAVLTFCAFVVETLGIVNDQVERRTYGEHSLKECIKAWETLIKQTRVVLLLRSRAGSSAGSGEGSGNEELQNSMEKRANSLLTVFNMSSGNVSLHRLLAADTLGFAVRAEQALEHEDKCRDVYARSAYNRRPSQLSGTSATSTLVSKVSPSDASTVRVMPSSTAQKSEVLLAWGPVADKRWKDLLSVAVAEDAIKAAMWSEQVAAAAIAAPTATMGGDRSAPSSNHSTQQQQQREEEKKRTMKRRRPLLLYFPMHSQAHLLGAYRSIILAERWAKSIHRIDLLVCACQHLFSLPQATWRAAVASHLYMTHIFPVFEVFISLEEDAQLLAVVSAAGANVSSIAMENEALNGIVGIKSIQLQQLLKLVADMRLLKTFVNSAAELLGFIELSVHCLSPPTVGRDSGSVSMNKKVAENTSVSAPWEHLDVKDAIHEIAEHRRKSVFHDEASHPVWPPQEDVYLNKMLIKYAYGVGGPHRRAHDNDSGSTGNSSSSGNNAVISHPTGTTSPAPGPTRVWTSAAVGLQISMLWVMHLRTLCSLRGVKPSEVLGSGVQQWLKEFRANHAFSQRDDIVVQYIQQAPADIKDACRQGHSTLSLPSVASSVQKEFLHQCLKQLVTARQPTGAVYILALRWIGMIRETSGKTSIVKDSTSPLRMDEVRLLHLNILLNVGGGSRDEEAEQMVPQINDTDLVLDTLIEALRKRFGRILSRIDQLPSYGPLIAAMDAEAVTWARSSVTTTNSASSSAVSTIATDATNNASKLNGNVLDGAQTEGSDSAESDLMTICRSLNINIASTRHLVICVQSNLLNVPDNMRRSHSSVSDEALGLSGAGNPTSVTWFQRKTRCDALLTLCKYFAQQFTATKSF